MFRIILFLVVVSIAEIELIKVPILCPFANLSSTVHNSSQIEFVECALNEICCQQVEEVITIEENNISVSSTACCSIRNIILENLLHRNISMADLNLNISLNSLKETSSYSSFFNASAIASISIALILFIILMIIIIIAIKYYKVKLYKERNLITSDYFSNNDKIATISSGGYYNNPAAAGNFIQYGGQQPVSSSSQTYNLNSYVQSSNYAAWKQQQEQSSWAQQYYGGYMNPYYNYYNNNNVAAKSCFYNNNLNTFIYQSNEVKKQQQQQPQPSSQYNLMKYLRYLNRKTFQTYLEYNQILEYLNK